MDEILEPDPAKMFGIRRAGAGISLYRRIILHDPCAYCGVEAPRGRYGGHEIDHIHARFRGGPNHWSNLTAACGFCNGTKFDMVLEQLLAIHDLRRGIVPKRKIR